MKQYLVLTVCISMTMSLVTENIDSVFIARYLNYSISNLSLSA
jgi:hypothetical protein